MFTKQKYEISLSACQLKQGVSILVSGLHINYTVNCGFKKIKSVKV